MSDTDVAGTLSPVKQALLEIRKLKDQLARNEARQHEPIAIVGIGCRLPGGVTDAVSYWELLAAGRDAIVEVPRERWDIAAFYDENPDAPGKMSTRWGGFIDGVDTFDAEFFNISAREAASLDPQQRLLLEVAWEALENAGIPADTLAGSATGVFTAMAAFDYPQQQLQALDARDIDAYFATGASHSVASGRISYFLGLKGPCMTVDTACSGSLVAVHLACQSLRLGECNLALAGGVSVLLLPELFVGFSNAHMMAADGRCKVFDAAADGYVRSEGCGMVILKRLNDAIADGDEVLAVIRGSAINHDGRSNGLTAPNGPSQVAVIKSALARAGVRPAQVGYVEAHGTGTSLGDPIEVHALGAAFGAQRSKERPLLIGSVKSNLGHLEAAAGIASLIKVALSLRERTLPGSLHFREPNPRIAWGGMPLEVVTRLSPWEPIDSTRIAGVSSFGFSGTNAHVVVAEAPDRPVRDASTARPLTLLTLSAKNEPALSAGASRIAVALNGRLQNVFPDVACTLNTGRARFAHRLAVVARSAREAAADLTAVAGGAESPNIIKGVVEALTSDVCFLFAGQGSQYPGMGQALFESEPLFRDALARCDAVLAPLLGRSLESLLYSGNRDALRSPQFAQPAIVALEYALSEIWREWGVTPAAVLGHSLGEYAAAVVAGVVSLEDGLTLVAERARLVEQRCAEGRMVAVRASADTIREILDEAGRAVSIAALNGPDSIVLSGSVDDVERVTQVLERRGVRVQPLETTRAFHSSLLEPALGEFEEIANKIEHRAPQVPFISNVDGAFLANGVGPTPGYWVEQARRPVRFHDGLRAAVVQGFGAFLEIGPSSTLTGIARESVATGPTEARRWLASLRRGRADWDQLLGTAAALYVQGIPLDWDAFHGATTRRRADIPTYAFQRKRYWFASRGPAVPSVPHNDRNRVVDATEAPVASSVWDRVTDAARRQAATVPIDLDLPSYEQRWALLDDLTAGYIVRTLRDLEAFRNRGAALSVSDMASSTGVLPMYVSLVERWLDRLVSRGLLRRNGATFTAPEPLAPAALAVLEERARAAFADAPYVVDYLVRCGELLTRIVTGKESALETLFPGGSRTTAVDLYRNWATSRYCNQIVGSAVTAMGALLSSTERLAILEIGAGTGSTTASVLPMLPPERTSYWFTDVSEFFFTAARTDFEAYPFVEYGVLDIERGPAEQGYGRNAFHAVIAANVLHATKDLGATMRNVLSLLRPGGLLVVYEVTNPQAWIDTSVALIAGWAKSADGLRDNGPLLSTAAWERLLRDTGFSEVVVLPERGSPSAVLGLSVIVARVQSAQHGAAVAPSAPSRAGAKPPLAAAERNEAVLANLRQALPGERVDLLVAFVREHVSAVLRRDSADETIGRRRNLMELGVDSLMAIELRDRLTTGLGVTKQLPASLIFDYPNIEAIANHLADLVGVDSAAGDVLPAAARAENGDVGARALAVASLSDDEIEAMLLKKLERR
jgi:acyl transferase domain-containing protein/SAM-dependent methyltransferase